MDIPSSESSILDAFITLQIAASYCSVAVTAFIVYDWIVTLSRELSLFFGHAKPIPTTLYFTNRYFTLLCQLATMYSFAPSSPAVCNERTFAFNIVTLVPLIPPAVFSGLRAYALSKKWRFSLTIFLLSMVQVVTNVILLCESSLFGVELPGLGCVPAANAPGSNSLIATSRASLIAADIMLIAMTARLVPERIVRKSVKLMSTKGFVGVLVSDGLLYFVVILTLNVLQLVFSQINTLSVHKTETYIVVLNSLISTFTAPLSSVLVSHFLLDLQDANRNSTKGVTSSGMLQVSQISTQHSIGFVSASGSLGSLSAVIEPPDWDTDDTTVEQYSETDYPSSASTLQGSSRALPLQEFRRQSSSIRNSVGEVLRMYWRNEDAEDSGDSDVAMVHRVNGASRPTSD